MDAYIYQGALYCPECAKKIKKALNKEIWGKGASYSFDPNDETSYDSNAYPKSTYSGGGESDSPEHCHECAVFLENPLTGEGEDYVVESVRREREKRKKGGKANPVVDEWREYYDYLDFGDEDEDEEESA